MPQVPTARGIKIRSASDAHLLFYAVHLGRLPIIQRRLDATERMEVTSGAVFVWEERSASTVATGSKMDPDSGPASGVISGIERWTDGLKWGPSRVRDDFLFYQEKDPDLTVSPPPLNNHHLYRTKRAGQPEPLIKQTYSVHYYPQILEGKPPTEPARKWHLTAYRSSDAVDRLADVTSVPELQNINPPEGLFRKARIGKKREGGPAGSGQQDASISPTATHSNYPLDAYGHGHGHGHSMNGLGHHPRGTSIASSAGWRETSIGGGGGPSGGGATNGSGGAPADSINGGGVHQQQRPLMPVQDGYGSTGAGGYQQQPPHEHAPPPSGGDYHTAPAGYPPNGHFPGSGAHHSHSHSGSMGYAGPPPHSPYMHAPAHAQGGGGYASGPTGYGYPDGRMAYSRPPEGHYVPPPPGGHDSPLPAHTLPPGETSSQGSMHPGQPYHHHPTSNQTPYDPYNPPNSAPHQNGLHQGTHEHPASVSAPTHNGLAHVRHSYSFSNGQPISEPAHPHHGANTRMHHHVRAESHPYPGASQQRPILPHSHSQGAPGLPLDHRRTFSQSSQSLGGVMDGIRSPSIGVARIRRGARKSEDSAALRQMMSRSPPSGAPINGAGPGRQVGGGPVLGGAEGARAQFSPYSRPINAPGPRGHPAMPSHPHTDVGEPQGPFDGSYTLRGGANGQDATSLHGRPPSAASRTFATPSVPSIPAHPDSHHYAPPVPPSLSRPELEQHQPSTGGYYLPQSHARQGGYPGPNGQPHFNQLDYTRVGHWTDVQSTAEPTSESGPLQERSVIPPPAGSHPDSQPYHHPGSGVDVNGGLSTVPVGTAPSGHMVPHPNPNFSPILTQFPISTSPGSSRSGSHVSFSGVPGSGSGVHYQHPATAAPMTNGHMWEGNANAAAAAAAAATAARVCTPVPPRIDTSIAGVNSSPVSVTAGGSVSGSASSKLGPLTPSTNLLTRDPEDERVLDLLSRGVVAPGSKPGAEGNPVPGGVNAEGELVNSDE